MTKLKMQTPDLTAQNIDKIAELFPNCITETVDENGQPKRAVNFPMLKQMLSGEVLDGDEAYEFTWVGKKASIVEANRPIRKTLRPCIEESRNWDETENLYIEGDNLEVLKLLQESYLGKVKMIYIDPPYNTGNDFIYRDDFKQTAAEYDEESGVFDEDENRLFKNTDSNGRFHSDWCSMIYPRLLLARNLLSDDGVIFISISDDEKDSLKKICDEIFGGQNFIATLIWDKNHSAQAGIYKVYHEYVVLYAKNISFISTPQSLNDDLFEAGAMKKASGRHSMQDFTFPVGTRFEAPDGVELEGEWGDVERVILVKGRMIARNKRLTENVTLKAAYTQISQMQQFFYGDKENLFDSRGQKIIEFYLNSSGKVKVVKRRAVETPQTTCHFGAQGPVSVELAKLFQTNDAPFDSPKPLNMIKDFVGRFTNDNDIVLDFFAGSSTTAHGLWELCAETGVKRKFILVQIPENLDISLKYASKDGKKTLETAISYLDRVKKPHLLTEIGKERIRRAGDKIKAETGADIDYGFRVFKVDDSNMNDIYYSVAELSQTTLASTLDNIKPDRSALDLLFGCLLDWGLSLSMPYKSEQLGGCTVHTYNEGDLLACFDMDIPEEVLVELAKRQPLRAVFRDSGFADSPAKINVFEIFKLYAPDCTVKVL